MAKYEVLSCSLVGHMPSECCAAYGCPCVVRDEADEEGAKDADEDGHDDERCECGVEVNDLHRASMIEVPDDPSDEALLKALCDGYLVPGTTLDEVEFDSGDGYLVEVNSTEGEPLFQLRLVEEYIEPVPEPLLDGQDPKSEIGPPALRDMRAYGGDWYAYQNADMSSGNIGHLQFLQCGEVRVHATPPICMPDTTFGPGWRYRLAGKVDLATGLIVKG